jgi:hypothetical protein
VAHDSPPTANLAVKGITNRPNPESQTQENRDPTPLCCKNEYLLGSNHSDRSIASEFFTGDYFRVMILLRVTLAGAGAYTISSAGQNPGAIILAIVISSVCLQAGYMVGLTSRDFFALILSRLKIVQYKRV